MSTKRIAVLSVVVVAVLLATARFSSAAPARDARAAESSAEVSSTFAP